MYTVRELRHIPHKIVKSEGEDFMVFTVDSYRDMNTIELFCLQEDVTCTKTTETISRVRVVFNLSYVTSPVNCYDCDDTGWFYQMEGVECPCQREEK